MNRFLTNEKGQYESIEEVETGSARSAVITALMRLSGLSATRASGNQGLENIMSNHPNRNNQHSVAITDIDPEYTPEVGDIVGVRSLIQGYGNKKWKLIESDWYGGQDQIPEMSRTSYSADNKTWSHAGRGVITEITENRVFFSPIG